MYMYIHFTHRLNTGGSGVNTVPGGGLQATAAAEVRVQVQQRHWRAVGLLSKTDRQTRQETDNV